MSKNTFSWRWCAVIEVAKTKSWASDHRCMYVLRKLVKARRRPQDLLNKIAKGKDNNALVSFVAHMFSIESAVVILPKLYPVIINRNTVSCIQTLLGQRELNCSIDEAIFLHLRTIAQRVEGTFVISYCIVGMKKQYPTRLNYTLHLCIVYNLLMIFFIHHLLVFHIFIVYINFSLKEKLIKWWRWSLIRLCCLVFYIRKESKASDQ